MKAELKLDSLNQILKGTDIYEVGDAVESIALVVKGKVLLHGHGVCLELGSGNFLGICDLTSETHNITYTAQTNAVVYVFHVSGTTQDIGMIMKANKEYSTLMVTSLAKSLTSLSDHFDTMDTMVEHAYDFMVGTYEKCLEVGQRSGTDMGKIESIESMRPFTSTQRLETEKIRYYRACTKIPSEIQKAYYGSMAEISFYHTTELIQMIRQLSQYCESFSKYLQKILESLILNNQSLYIMTARLITVLQHIGIDEGELLMLLDDIIDEINKIEDTLQKSAGIKVDIDREFMEETYFMLLNPEDKVEEDGIDGSMATAADDGLALVDAPKFALDDLKDSLGQICQYASFDVQERDNLKSFLETFQSLPDKLATNDETRALRKSLSNVFYELYKQVFLCAEKEPQTIPLAVNLFLRFGFLSEKLLPEEQQEALLRLDSEFYGTACCNVYDMWEWLRAIHRGEKEPSKNEFDLNYEQNLREQRKNGEITPEEMEQFAKDKDRKLDFEFRNLFKGNHRLVNGQVSIFVPFLYKEGCTLSIDRSYLSKDKINAAVNRLKQIDYSIFYRESLMKGDVVEFAKEHVMAEYTPDIILFPGVGSRGMMWQELSGRSRTSSGRFLLPMLLDGDLDRVLMRMFGAFRWEVCRTIQGAFWNSLQSKSLTSEYMDFIQFYKKNKDLSDAKKEKLKMKIRKYRNNTREVFVNDYCSWIRHEANGGLVLSKPVREIMATYCPFNREIRKEINEQPIFAEAMKRYGREKAKIIKEYDLKYKVWNKNGLVIPEEIQNTRNYYTEL